MQKIRYLFEAIALYALYYFFKILPIEKASNFGGWLTKTIGSRMAVSRKALHNIELSLPELPASEHHEIVKDMWENLGRTFAENPHLNEISKSRTIIQSEIDLKQYKSERKAVFAGAHYGNWEIGCAAPYYQLGLEIDSTYRPPNNSWVESLLLKNRTLDGKLSSFPKSRSGGMAMLKAAKNDRNLIILFDQKYNEGVNVPLFGRDAMTNPVFIQIAQKYGMDVLPTRVVRDGAARLRLLIEKPLRLYEDNGDTRPVENVIADAHKILESWIREHPGHWLWLHRRWKD